MSEFKGTLIRAGGNAKTVKGDGSEYVTAILYMAPADAVAGINVCPMAKLAGCKAACLNTAGRGVMSNVQAGRARKTMWYRDDRAGFLATLVKDVERFTKWCAKRGVKPVVRLNGTSDIQWERGHPVERGGERFATIFAAFPGVQFYDYTKIAKRAYRDLPGNYDLTLSYSEANRGYADAIKIASAETGARVAVVFRTPEAAQGYIGSDDGFEGVEAIDGDDDDLRFLDPAGVVVALYAKGKAKTDTSGFVVS